MSLLNIVGAAALAGGLILLGIDGARLNNSARAAITRGDEWRGETNLIAFMGGLVLLVLGVSLLSCAG